MKMNLLFVLALLSIAFVFAGVGCTPGISTGLRNFSWYVAGLCIGIIIGWQGTILGWLAS